MRSPRRTRTKLCSRRDNGGFLRENALASSFDKLSEEIRIKLENHNALAEELICRTLASAIRKPIC